MPGTPSPANGALPPSSSSPAPPGDTLVTANGPRGPWQPGGEGAEPDEPAVPDPRVLAPETLQRIDRWVGQVFARRPAPPVSAARVRKPPPVFDPASAGTNGDGSFVPPDGRAVPGAPAPGQGKLTPPGLAGGNSVFRYGETGEPTNFQILDQGSTNGCGTTSLAMLLDFLAGGKKVFDREGVDAAIRHFNMFSSPGEIAAFARKRGLDATVHSGTAPDDLRRMVDQGLPVQVLLDVSEAHDGSGLHFELITGYGTGPDGKRYFELANPWGMREYMAEDALLARWRNLTGKGFPLGIDRVAITMKPRGSAATLLPNDEGAWLESGMTALRVARGLTQVTSGWARRDVAKLVAGGTRLVLGGILAVPALLGHAGRKASVRVMDEGKQEIGKGVGGFFKGLGKVVAGGLGVALSAAVEATGNVGNRLVDFLADGAYSAARGIGRLLRRK